MPDSVVMRLVHLDDVSRLTQLMLTYIVDFYHRPEPGQAAVVDRIRHFLSNPRDGNPFVAEAEGVVVGFVTLYFTFSTLRLRRIAVMND